MPSGYIPVHTACSSCRAQPPLPCTFQGKTILLPTINSMHPNKFLLRHLPVPPGEALWHLPQHLLLYQRSRDKPLSVIRRITCSLKEGGKPAQAPTGLTTSKAPRAGAGVWHGARRRCQEEGWMEPACQSLSSLISVPGADKSPAGELGLGSTAASTTGTQGSRTRWILPGHGAGAPVTPGPGWRGGHPHQQGLTGAARATAGLGIGISAPSQARCLDPNTSGRMVPRKNKAIPVFGRSKRSHSKCTNAHSGSRMARR